MYNFKSLYQDLEAAGLRHTDTVLIHSSMKSIGAVEDGAQTVLAALEKYFSQGLLLFPTLSYSLVNAKQPLFSVTGTPSIVGILPELFRCHSEVIRSLHPTHSISGRGKYAWDFLEGHEKFITPCARHSPWGRLIDYDAKIIFIGTGINCNTFLHGVEEWVPVPGMFADEIENLVVQDKNGRLISVPSKRHKGGHSSCFHLAEPIFRRVGALYEFKFGDAACISIDAAPGGEAVLQTLKKQPFLFTPNIEKNSGEVSSFESGGQF